MLLLISFKFCTQFVVQYQEVERHKHTLIWLFCTCQEVEVVFALQSACFHALAAYA